MHRIFYGWVITGVSALANTLAWSVRSTFALFYVALLHEFGWGRAETALGYSLSWLLLLVFSPLAGRLNDRFGPQGLVPVGGMLLARRPRAYRTHPGALAVLPGVRRAGSGRHRLHHDARRGGHRPLVHPLARRGHGDHQRRVLAHDVTLLLIYAAAGVGFGMRISLLTAIPADLFAGRSFGAILGFTNGGGGLGGFIGPFLAGYLFDRTADYQLAFAVSALAIAGSTVAVWVAGPRKSAAGRPLAFWHGFDLVLREPNTWLLGGYAFLLFGTMTMMQGLWAVPSLMDIHGHTQQEASSSPP